MKKGFLALGALVLTACANTSTAPVPAEKSLSFLDVQSFDARMSASLNAQLPEVKVKFYDRVSPSALPERVQNWMAAVENNGGRVSVVPPKSTLTAKNPFLLIGAISSLWSASRTAQEISREARFKAAAQYDARVVLGTDDNGQSVVDHLEFVQRPL